MIRFLSLFAIVLTFSVNAFAGQDYELSDARYDEIKTEIQKNYDALVKEHYLLPIIMRLPKYQFDRLREIEDKKTPSIGVMYVDGADQESLNFIAKLF